MNILKIKLVKSRLVEHYQYGMLKLLRVPVNYGVDCADEDSEFFAYISTLGGGLLEGDKYEQSFTLDNAKSVISSQSSQKIYKGSSCVNTKIDLKNNASFVFHNDANIFYPNANFTSKSTINLSKDSKLFYVDGGFLGYSEGNFKSYMGLKIYIDSKLALNDVFYYDSKSSVQSLYQHEYFYNIIVYADIKIEEIQEEHIKAHSSKINGITIVRILSDNNGEAIKYINSIKESFLKQSNMTLTSIR